MNRRRNFSALPDRNQSHEIEGESGSTRPMLLLLLKDEMGKNEKVMTTSLSVLWRSFDANNQLTLSFLQARRAWSLNSSLFLFCCGLSDMDRSILLSWKMAKLIKQFYNDVKEEFSMYESSKKLICQPDALNNLWLVIHNLTETF